MELYRVPALDAWVPFQDHTVSVHLKGPIGLLQQRGKRTDERTMQAGDAIVTPAGEPKRLRHHAEAEVVRIRLSRPFVAAIAAQISEADAQRLELCDRFGTRDPLLEHLARQLLAELRTSGLGSRLCAESLAAQAAVHLLRHYSVERPGAQRSSGALPASKLRRAIEFMTENLPEDFALADIAAAVSLSPYHFAHRFKRTTGRSPHQYVIGLRLDQAKKLLRETELPVTEIAEQVGYANMSHFSVAFHRASGLTPTQYRRDA